MDNIWQRRKGSFCGWVTPPLHIFLLTALGLLLAGDNNRLQVDGESLSIHLCIIRPVIPTNAFGKPHAYYQRSVDTEMMNNFLWGNNKKKCGWRRRRRKNRFETALAVIYVHKEEKKNADQKGSRCCFPLDSSRLAILLLLHLVPIVLLLLFFFKVIHSPAIYHHWAKILDGQEIEAFYKV